VSRRIEDTPELFGEGVGTSCMGDIQCRLCQTLHNPEETGDEPDGEPIRNTIFAGYTICECCFADIEEEVLCRMPSILPWYRRILERRRKRLETAEGSLGFLGKAQSLPPLIMKLRCPTCDTPISYSLDRDVNLDEPVETACPHCDAEITASVQVLARPVKSTSKE
jgi:hypothetical protein